MQRFRQILGGVVTVPFLAGIALGSAVTGAGAAMRGSAIFKDVAPGTYYDDAVGEMYGAGIIKGVDDSHFDPNAYVTRGQLAVLFKRLRDDIRGSGDAPPPPPPPPPAESGSSNSSSSRSRRSLSSKSSSSRSSKASSSSADPAAGVIEFSIAGLSISEGAPKATVAVNRVGGTKGIVSVTFKTVDGTATEGQDYVSGGGTITFANGETQKMVSIGLKDDLTGESNETFDIVLSTPSQGTALGSKPKATVTILDNDGGSGQSSSSAASATSSAASVGSLGFLAPTYGWMENAGAVTLTVNREGGSKGAVVVNYATSNGTAQSGTDYAATSGTLNFADGETTKTFTVTVNNNSSIDGNKTVNLSLSNPTGGAGLSATRNAVLTIVDDETNTTGAGTVQFSSDSYTAGKGSKLAVTVRRLNGHDGTVAVNYSTNDGSAASNVDYKPVSGILTFGPGETSKTFTVEILSGAKPDRTVGLAISAASTNPATLGSPATAIITLY